MTTLPFDHARPRPQLRRSTFCRLLSAGLIGLSAIAVLLQLGLFFKAPGDAALVFLTALVMSGALTVLPVWLLWNLERRERASIWFFGMALLWGGFIATALAIPVNSYFFQVVDVWVTRHPMVTQVLGPDAAQLLSAPMSAPISEELAKALGIAVIFAMLRGEFNSVRDGLVYGALVGIGFNWYETALYVAQDYVKHGVAPYGLQLGGRFALLGFGGHALFSGIFGGFLGYAMVERRWLLKISAPIVGLLLAIGAHMFNNALPLLVTLAGAGAGVDRYETEQPLPDIGFFEAMIGSSIREAIIFLPFVMVAALVLWRSDVWERRVIREELSNEVGGAVSAGEYRDIAGDTAMRTARLDHIPKIIAPDLVNLQNELAFRKHWLKDEGLDPEYDPVTARLREQIGRLRAAG
jgi:RsiW-degrading membrane proteinase PrsW (M82 family)